MCRFFSWHSFGRTIGNGESRKIMKYWVLSSHFISSRQVFQIVLNGRGSKLLIFLLRCILRKNRKGINLICLSRPSNQHTSLRSITSWNIKYCNVFQPAVSVGIIITFLFCISSHAYPRIFIFLFIFKNKLDKHTLVSVTIRNLTAFTF